MNLYSKKIEGELLEYIGTMILSEQWDYLGRKLTIQEQVELLYLSSLVLENIYFKKVMTHPNLVTEWELISKFWKLEAVINFLEFCKKSKGKEFITFCETIKISEKSLKEMKVESKKEKVTLDTIILMKDFLTQEAKPLIQRGCS